MRYFKACNWNAWLSIKILLPAQQHMHVKEKRFPLMIIIWVFVFILMNIKKKWELMLSSNKVYNVWFPFVVNGAASDYALMRSQTKNILNTVQRKILKTSLKLGGITL